MLRSWLTAILTTSITVSGGVFASASPDPAAAEAIASGYRLVAAADHPRELRIFYTPPILVRAGEQVRIPVDVVCSDEQGEPCTPSVSVAAASGPPALPAWRTATAGSEAPSVQFDLTAPAARAVQASPTGSVAFVIRAADGAGRTAVLPQEGEMHPLRFYVTRRLVPLSVPSLPFGEVRTPRTVLFLPWGSGRSRAGLALGSERAALGPPSFDVDGAGRIYLLDALHGRLAVFAGGRLIRQSGLTIGSRADLAVTDGGRAYVLDSSGGELTVRTIDEVGEVLPPVAVGSGPISQVRTVRGRALVNVLPMDAWVPVPRQSDPDAQIPGDRSFTVGRPLASGEQLLRVGSEHNIRLGRVHGDVVDGAVELRLAVRLGEVALAEPDGAKGYWTVVRVWRERPTPLDQFQVIHVRRDRLASTFAVADQSFAHTPPLSRFRLGKDGGLYQLQTFPDGIRIVRYDLGRDR